MEPACAQLWATRIVTFPNCQLVGVGVSKQRHATLSNRNSTVTERNAVSQDLAPLFVRKDMYLFGKASIHPSFDIIANHIRYLRNKGALTVCLHERGRSRTSQDPSIYAFESLLRLEGSPQFNTFRRDRSSQ